MKKKIKVFGYCLLLSFLFLLICSRNSFLYPMNTWKDANAFFTVGKEMIRGFVPYKVLFEQKGPLLYLIYGIGSIISFKSFIGIFLLEVISFSIFLYYTHKVICLFLKEKQSYLILPFYTLGIVTLKAFTYGGSAEEFLFPFIMISIYHLSSYLKTKEIHMNKKILFINGLFAGCALWIKYTLLGFYFGWMLSIFLIQMINKEYKEAIKNCFLFLLGMLIATLPWLLYFYFNNALKDMWEVYFLVNIHSYPVKVSFLKKCYKTFQIILGNTFGNTTMFLGTVVGFVCLFHKKEVFKKKHASFFIFLCYITMCIFIYIGGTNYRYYALPLAIFSLMGYIAFLSYIKPKNIKRLLIIFIPLCLISAYTASPNTKALLKNKKHYAQYIFAEIIGQKENASVLNYGFLDGGFYLTTGNQPTFYYFMKNNIPYKNYPEMMDEQDRYVKEAIPDYVIAKHTLSKERFILLKKNYHEIKSHHQLDDYDVPVTYILYERN